MSLHPGGCAQHLPALLPQTLEQGLHRALWTGASGQGGTAQPTCPGGCPGSPFASSGQALPTGNGLPQGAVGAMGRMERTAQRPGPSPSCPGAAQSLPSRAPGQALQGHASTRTSGELESLIWASARSLLTPELRSSRCSLGTSRAAMRRWTGRRSPQAWDWTSLHWGSSSLFRPQGVCLGGLGGGGLGEGCAHPTGQQ